MTQKSTPLPEFVPLDLDPLAQRLRAALAEDLGSGDVTSEVTLPEDAEGEAIIRAKAPGRLCGVPVAQWIFQWVDLATRIETLLEEGVALAPGDAVMRIQGKLRSILAGERVALNFLQRMSGIATLTRQYVDVIPSGCDLSICDTRKTTPLWRDLERYAVRVGGGTNHRSGLWDMIMIKDTHVEANGSLAEALRRVKEANRAVPVAAEARTYEEAEAAAQAGVDILMLDNMNNDSVQKAVSTFGQDSVIEVTGGVTIERIPTLAQLGVNRVSIGALTHSAPALDLSLTLQS